MNDFGIMHICILLRNAFNQIRGLKFNIVSFMQQVDADVVVEKKTVPVMFL